MLWSVRVEVAAPPGLPADSIEAIRDKLNAHSASVGAVTPGRLSIQLAIDAYDITAAQEHARNGVEAAFENLVSVPPEIVRMDALLWEDFEAETEQAPAELMGSHEFAELAGVSRQRIQQLAKDAEAGRGDFPRPLVRLSAGPVWLGATARRWAKTAPRRNGRPPKSQTA